MQKLVVIGAGMASGRVLEHLFESAPSAFEVTLFNAEPRGNYNRIMLSPVLSGEKSYEEIVTHDDAWYAENAVACRFGEPVVSIDRDRKVVVGAKGEVAYDKLVIATGSSPFIVPVPGKDLPGVVAYRDLDDTNAMIEASVPGARAVVIGGGLLGLEAAAGLRLRGMEVTVVHLMGHLMERQLDEAAGYLLRKDLEKRGITVLTRASTKAILGTEKVEGVALEDGSVIPADLVVMAVGIRPETRVAKAAGVEVNRGIKVDAQMRTSDPDVFAVGECVEFEGILFGLVAPLYDQAKVLAATLLGETAAFTPKELSTKLKVTGCDLFSAGDFAEGEGRDDIVLRDPARGIYRRLVLEGDRVLGAVMYGDTAEGGWFFDLIRDGTDVGAMRDTLIFGQAYQGGSPLDPMAAVAALPDDAEICGCNGVCKGTIVKAITEKGLTSLEEVRAVTKASASCGQCTGKVEQVLAVTLGDAFTGPARKTMCKCTDLTHGEARDFIRAKGLKSIPAVMQELGWKTPNGCASCRPALNYYLVCDWPGEYEDDGRSRFINERVHANIQKDGTFSVVPRMWGGLTTAAELRAIADIAEKHAVPLVKMTGGQRIDMLGIKKENLPAIWRDLNEVGLVSGHAYSKGLRTVKTCVGKEWCRFGTQDSMGLGVKLEKLMWGSWTPAKVKLAVSGCPRNCSEATVKDIGVICVDSGYDIHISGAAGLHVRATDLLCHVDTEEEALEYSGAVLQMYREGAWYLERIYKWQERVGLDTIKATIVDDPAAREALWERFLLSQKFAQIDPWAERVAGLESHEFSPITIVPALAAE
ncbi:nitrite reductase large subunit NirB [Pinisolibacter aquiterrae]|uniref:nitrite reductase large subunit NirB n=1 Tax=Pinisolibacter aquiterrae TaxID=2815579 RepID=UPI001C3E5D93|nr:nitrite reductase large subunit NirB [Pinisolibacter aquiterrae]MBV5266368.1 NAD(P)/FAD-dependent oxidoreductase [Pinisolibacter aquiterrae]MCC8236515.1 nitrite reductase large subunit NirB [Pinisolibacter aquiterrae]